MFAIALYIFIAIRLSCCCAVLNGAVGAAEGKPIGAEVGAGVGVGVGEVPRNNSRIAWLFVSAI